MLYCVFVVGCDGLVAGATTAALSNRGELLGAMQMGRLLMRRGMPCLHFVLGVPYTEGFSVPYTEFYGSAVTGARYCDAAKL
eukprot:scaffold58921_cov27-Cyclotella_meneghiniana.AAC.2